MEPNSTYDQEIDLKDLMFAVLYKWPCPKIGLVLTGLLFQLLPALSTFSPQPKKSGEGHCFPATFLLSGELIAFIFGY